MQIVARLGEATLRQLLDELLPVTILLDDEGKEGRWVTINPAQTVDFVAGQGLRLATSGRIRWVAAGLPIEATLNSVRVLLRPIIIPQPEGGRLVFRASLEEADLKNVPALLDRGITALVNRQLEARSDQIGWDFGHTLHSAVPLPPALDGLAALRLGVQEGKIEISDNALELTLSLGLHFVRAEGVVSLNR